MAFPVTGTDQEIRRTRIGRPVGWALQGIGIQSGARQDLCHQCDLDRMAAVRGARNGNLEGSKRRAKVEGYPRLKRLRRRPQEKGAVDVADTRDQPPVGRDDCDRSLMAGLSETGPGSDGERGQLETASPCSKR